MTALRSELSLYRPLSGDELPLLRQLVDADPYANAVLAARLDQAGVDSLGAPVLVLEGATQLRAACYLGGNTLPVGGDEQGWHLLGRTLARHRRGCGAVIGRAEALAAIVPCLTPSWGQPRLTRWNQPLLVLNRLPSVPADETVRPAQPGEADVYLPAVAAMFGEELGLGPFAVSAASAYRARLRELIAQRRAFVRLDRQGRVAFKAELAAVSRATCQIQGVWVRPDLRGRGVATSGLAAVTGYALRLAPTVSLYVNDFNLAARTVYARLGMRQVGTLASVLY